MYFKRLLTILFFVYVVFYSEIPYARAILVVTFILVLYNSFAQVRIFNSKLFSTIVKYVKSQYARP